MYIEQKVRKLRTLSNNDRWNNAPLRGLGTVHFMGMLAAFDTFRGLSRSFTAEEGALHLRAHVVFAADAVSYSQTFPLEGKKEFRSCGEVFSR